MMYNLSVIVFCNIFVVTLSLYANVKLVRSKTERNNSLSPLIFLVNHMELATQFDSTSRMYRATYYYAEGDLIEATCINEAFEDHDLRLVYHYAKLQHESFKPDVSSQATAATIRFRTKMDAAHNNSYLYCSRGYHFAKIKVTFVLQKIFLGYINLKINGLPVRPIRSLRYVIQIKGKMFDSIHIEYEAISKDVILSYPSDVTLCGVIDKYKKIFTNAVKFNETVLQLYCVYHQDYNSSNTVLLDMVTIQLVPLPGILSFDSMPSITTNVLPNNLKLGRYVEVSQPVAYEYDDGDHFSMNCSMERWFLQDGHSYLEFNGSVDTSMKIVSKDLVLSSADDKKKLTCYLCSDSNCNTVLGAMQVTLVCNNNTHSNSNIQDGEHTMPRSTYSLIVAISVSMIMVGLVIIALIYYCRKAMVFIDTKMHNDCIQDNDDPALRLRQPAEQPSESSPPEYDYVYDKDMNVLAPRVCPQHSTHTGEPEPSPVEYDYVYDGMLRP